MKTETLSPELLQKMDAYWVRMPDFRDYAVDVPSPGVRGIGDTHVLGHFLRDVSALNSEQRKFRGFGQWNVQEPK